MFRTLAGLAACLVFATSPVAAQDAGPKKVGTIEGVTEYTLTNGLRVLLIPDATQPKVTVACTIFVGSRHEGYGESGMAHLLEHMVFKGCTKFPDVPKALRDHGANFNGTTWVDRTNYYETMPAGDDNLEFGIELEADRFTNSFIKREDLLSEFSVVRNEFESGENDSNRVLMQKMMAAAFEWHNYGKSTIGNRTDIERVPIDNLQAFYKKYYRPDNAMMIIAGKFDEAKALAMIQKYWGPLKNPAEPLSKTYTEEPAQDGERIVTLRRVGTVGAAGVAYHTPAASHPDFPAVQVLANILTDEPNGRLYKALIEPKLASSVQGLAFNWHDPGLLMVGVQADPDKTDVARDKLIEVMETLANAPATSVEVERAKRQLVQQRERQLANSQGFAIGLSDWAGCGDWRLFFLHRDRLEKVTADDVNRVAKQYLLRSNRTVGTFIPTKAPERVTVPNSPEVAGVLKDYKGRAALASGEAFDPTPENVNARVKNGVVGEGVKYALLSKKTRGETVDAQLTLHYGNLESLKGQSDAAEFLGTMMMRGTTTKSRLEIKDAFEKLNATVSFGSSDGRLSATIKTKKANLPAVLTLLGEVLRTPSFPDKEFELLQKEQISETEQGKTEPTTLARTAFRRKLSPYPPEDPRYTPTVEESLTRLKSLTVAKVKELYTTQLNGQHGELAIVGDFDQDAAIEAVDKSLKGWKSTVPYVRLESKLFPATGGVEKINTPDKDNAIYLAGMTIPLKDTDPEYAAMVIGNYVLGAAPLASKLSNRVRGKDGLSYGVGSQVAASAVDPVGMFMVFAITNPKNLDKVDAAVREEIEKFLKDGLSADELEQAKKAYLQSMKQQRTNDGTLAGMLVKELHAGRTFSYYDELEKRLDAVQPTDVKKAFDKFVEWKKLSVIEAGDLEKK
ncbi:pitrilysin family protein [soil metagenome]